MSLPATVARAHLAATPPPTGSGSVPATPRHPTAVSVPPRPPPTPCRCVAPSPSRPPPHRAHLKGAPPRRRRFSLFPPHLVLLGHGSSHRTLPLVHVRPPRASPSSLDWEPLTPHSQWAPPPKPPCLVELAPHLPRGLSLLQGITRATVDHRSVAIKRDCHRHRASTASQPCRHSVEASPAPPCPADSWCCASACRKDIGDGWAPSGCRQARHRGHGDHTCAGRRPGSGQPGQQCQTRGPKAAQHCAESFSIFYFSLYSRKLVWTSKIWRKYNTTQKYMK
jgi:hypothetical protein